MINRIILGLHKYEVIILKILFILSAPADLLTASLVRIYYLLYTFLMNRVNILLYLSYTLSTSPIFLLCIV